MNQTYTAPKNWHYFKKEGFTALRSIKSPVNAKSFPGVMHTAKPFFRFSVLITDFLFINIVSFALIQLLERVSYSTQYLLFILVANVCWMAASYITGQYFTADKFFKRTAATFSLYIAGTLFFIFMMKYDYSRAFVLLSFGGFGTVLLVSRTIALGAQQFLQRKVIDRKVVFLGCNDLSDRLANTLEYRDRGIKINGYFDDDIQKMFADTTYPVLGNLNDCVQYAINNQVAEIYSTIPPESNPQVYEIAQQAEQNFIRFKFVPDFTMLINRKVHLGFEDDIPVLTLHHEPLTNIDNRARKRAFDIMFSMMVIFFILSWLIPLMAILVKLDSRGPVFFRQLRSGKNGVPFLCFKFRTLKVNKEADVKQVTKNDQRLTRLGKFLRKTNIDELPQFFNVLQGYMSVVGPRPHMLKHTEEYSALMNQYMVRHFVKPGITGLAQINGCRGEIKRKEQLQKRIEYDINYLENWSMWLDCRIILLTVYKTIIGDKNAF